MSKLNLNLPDVQISSYVSKCIFFLTLFYVFGLLVRSFFEPIPDHQMNLLQYLFYANIIILKLSSNEESTKRTIRKKRNVSTEKRRNTNSR
jgi:hypothetical protein